MAAKQATKGLILVDFINEIIDAKGKFAGHGYADFAEQHRTLDRASTLLEKARAHEIPVFHVGLAFSPDYKEQPEQSPLFGSANIYGAVQAGTWATDFHPRVAPIDGETLITKHRVSAFFGTPLDLILRTYRISELLVVGCATDMAVQSTIRDAHDRDYQCTVVADCCAAATDGDHSQTVRMLAKVSKVLNLNEVLPLL